MLSIHKKTKEDAMDSLPQKPGRNYTPHLFETRKNCCKRRRESGWPIGKILSYYHVRRSSLYRWLKRYDGLGEQGLRDLSHKPKSDHPKKTPKKTAYKIKCLRDQAGRNAWSSVDIWVKLNSLEGFQASYSTVLRILKRLDGYEPYRTNPKKRHDKVYHTPELPGEKWQVDVKYVPSECKAPGLEGRFYQYTYLDEATRKRYLHFSNEHSMYETVSGLREAIAFFGYKPKEIQTDNGFEFSDRAAAKGKGSAAGRDGPNILERFCAENGIAHKFIRPRTPEHNGKVERSHRIDQEKFYRFLRFYSLADLAAQGARWNRRYNETPRISLDLRSPNQVELEKLRDLMLTTGEVRCPKLAKRLTSIDN